METHDRFLTKLEKKDGHWMWLGKLCRGYGTFWANGKTNRVHRYSYEFYKEPIPKGMVIDHLCRIRNCVNPQHLEVVTNKENVLRGTGPSAKHARKTHCVNGHPLSGSNLGVSKNGRYCRLDNTEAKRRERKRNRILKD